MAVRPRGVPEQNGVPQGGAGSERRGGFLTVLRRRDIRGLPVLYLSLRFPDEARRPDPPDCGAEGSVQLRLSLPLNSALQSSRTAAALPTMHLRPLQPTPCSRSAAPR